MSSADKLVRKSLDGTIRLMGDMGPKLANSGTVGLATVEGINYSEIINRSEDRSGLAKPNYN